MFKTILIPTDGSDVARKAIKAGVALAKRLGASVIAYTATEPVQHMYYAAESGIHATLIRTLEERTSEQARQYVAEIEKAARAASVSCETVITRPSTPDQGIIAAARKKKCDLIFMSSHGRGGFASLILGSVTHKVLAHSKIPVVVYR